MTKKTAPKKPRATAKPRKLDETTSAHVIAEYLAIEKVATKEIDQIMDVPHGLSHREIAVTFRISEILDIPPMFTMSPRFRVAFARAQEYVQIHKLATESAS